MPINVKQGRVRTRTYAVKGNSLQDINEYISRNGPKDPNENRRYAGVCKCTAVLHDRSIKLDFATEKKGRNYESQVWITKGKLTYDCTIKVPVLGRAELSADARREWNRFVGCVNVHEQGHVTSYGKEMKAIGREIEAIKTIGKHRSEDRAKRAALASLRTELQAIDLAKRIGQDAARYDRKWRHGAKQGAVLDTSIQ